MPETDWENLVRQHSGIVWQTAWRLLRDEAEASDCYQETFVSALEVAGREPVGNWPALLRHLATNHALTRLRRRHRRDRYEHNGRHDPIELSSLPTRQSGPVENAQAHELAERLDVALASIPADQAEVFCLRFFGDLSNGDIARRLGVTANAVGVLLHRARSHIGRLLSPDTKPGTLENRQDPHRNTSSEVKP